MFLTEDVQKAVNFSEFIKKYASWDMGTEQVLELVKHLSWYNQTVQKINDHVLELKKTITKPAEPVAIAAEAAPEVKAAG